MKKILIMAGGTGGHVFPGLAVADYLRQHGHQVVWLGTLHGLDTTVVPQAKIPFYQVSIRGLRGKGWLGLLLAPIKICQAIIQSWRILSAVQPDVVLGMGGYVTGPGGVACWLKRIPLVIHEQNALPGKTNLLLSRIATRNLQAFPNSFRPRAKAVWVGNPIRDTICHLPAPAQRLDLQREKLNVLIFGGSQGAQAINQCILQLVQDDYAKEKLSVWHQVGKQHYEIVVQQYQQLQFSAKVTAFIDDMAAAYAWADVVICRAGALSVSELASAGVASILIPFPYAVDDHQTANAQFLQQAKAAIVVQEKNLSAKMLLEVLQSLNYDREKLLLMAENARKLAKPEATQYVADICIEQAR